MRMILKMGQHKRFRVVQDGFRSTSVRAADEGFMLSDKKKLEIASIIKVLRSGSQGVEGWEHQLLGFFFLPCGCCTLKAFAWQCPILALNLVPK